MPRKKAIRLSRKARQKLLKVATVGVNNARVIVRAQILLKVADGWTDEKIAEAFNVGSSTVRRLRLKSAAHGLESALEEAPRSGGA